MFAAMLLALVSHTAGAGAPAPVAIAPNLAASTLYQSRYLRTDKTPVARSYHEARRRLLVMSFDPHQCSELR